MQIWKLTALGKRMARSVRNPNTPAYKVLHALDRLGAATSEQIAQMESLSTVDVGMGIAKLKAFNPPLVEPV